MPRRYGQDGRRLWNGKPPEEFTTEDTRLFLTETENLLNGKDDAIMAKTNTNAAQEVSNQAEYNYYLMEAPIADFASYAGIELDEAVSRRIEEARKIPNLSEIQVDVRLLNQPNGKHIGMAAVEYHGFRMDNFKLFNGENGLFLGEPTVRDGRTNNFVKTIRVTGDELRDTLNRKVLEGYRAAVEKLQIRAAEARNMEVKPSIRKDMADGARQAEAYNTARPAQARESKAKSTER